MADSPIDEDWWPDLLAHIPGERPWESDPVVVAEVGKHPTRGGTRLLCTALVPPSKVERVISQRERTAYQVSFWPAYGDPDDVRPPRFVVDGDPDSTDGFEPIVVSWESSGLTVLWPDQGFIAQYGLIPRFLNPTGLETAWDDPRLPRHNVVTATALSVYDYPRDSYGVVKIARDVLQDYATIRESALVQFFYERQDGPLPPGVENLLGDSDVKVFPLGGRYVDLRKIRIGLEASVERRACAQVWGVRLLARPGTAPITHGRRDYGSLTWPGFSTPLDYDKARATRPLSLAYIRDDVLASYEGRPEFAISPESGAVSRGGQWSVGYCHRVGRDLIAVELKKLYEGAPPEVVRYWHGFAVAPPPHPLARDSANVATRAKRVTFALIDLGEALATLVNKILRSNLTSNDVVGLLRTELDYNGWWRDKNVEPITRQIPLSMNRDQFLARCVSLNNLIAEGLAQKHLRRALEQLGANPEELKGFRSIKLLGRLVQLAEISAESGLDLIRDFAELDHRRSELPPERESAATNRLQALYELRVLSGHRIDSDEQQRLDAAMAALGISASSLVAGWGEALDRVYDQLAETIESITGLLLPSV